MMVMGVEKECLLLLGRAVVKGRLLVLMGRVVERECPLLLVGRVVARECPGVVRVAAPTHTTVMAFTNLASTHANMAGGAAGPYTKNPHVCLGIHLPAPEGMGGLMVMSRVVKSSTALQHQRHL
jgi:hypothetical protein